MRASSLACTAPAAMETLYVGLPEEKATGCVCPAWVGASQLTDRGIYNWKESACPTEFVERLDCFQVAAAQNGTESYKTQHMAGSYTLATHLDHRSRAALSAAARALFFSNDFGSSRCPMNFALILRKLRRMRPWNHLPHYHAKYIQVVCMDASKNLKCLPQFCSDRSSICRRVDLQALSQFQQRLRIAFVHKQCHSLLNLLRRCVC